MTKLPDPIIMISVLFLSLRYIYIETCYMHIV